MDFLDVDFFDPSAALPSTLLGTGRTGFLILSFEFGGFWFVGGRIKRQYFGIFFA